MNERLDRLIEEHRSVFESNAQVMATFLKPGSGTKFEAVVNATHDAGLGFYVIVDEYDNFTNEIVASIGKLPYKEITHGTGFYRGWFKKFKGSCDRIFMSGVSPVTMDDLTSGFNIATNISQDENFNAMVGFTYDEVHQLFTDFKGCGKYVNDVEKHLETVRKWYDGYCFAEGKVGSEHLFNCDMALYYLGNLVAHGVPPRNLIDTNIRSDWSKLKTILDAQHVAEQRDGILPLTQELADSEEVTFNLVDSFPIETVTDEKNFKSLYYYYGIVTMSRFRRGNLQFRIPNECVRRQIFEYMREQYENRGAAVNFDEFIAHFIDLEFVGREMRVCEEIVF